MRSTSFLVALVVAALAEGAAISSVPMSHSLHEKRDIASASSWAKRDRLHSRAILPMRIGLKQRNLHKGYELLMDVSHPDSPNYAKHWTPEAVIEMFSPEQETVDSVTGWLIESGISADRITHSDNRGWIAFDATAEEAENLLKTDFHNFEHSGTGAVTPACDAYHIPRHVQRHVDYITPGVKLMPPLDKRATRLSRRKISGSIHNSQNPKMLRPEVSHATNASDLTHCDKAITPACIAALYQIPPVEYPNGAPLAGNAMGIFEEGDYYAQEDLDLFFKNQSLPIPAGTGPTPAFIDGATAPVPVAQAGGESDLDFELAYPILYPQKITLYQTDDIPNAQGQTNATGFFNTFLDALDGSYCTYEGGNSPLDPVYPDTHKGGYTGKLQCGVYTPTNVISVSYGGQESDLPPAYQERQCNEFMKLGLQGHSIFFASGDDGVAGPPGDGSANGCLGKGGKVFSPAWPNSCPYLTNVGATKVYPGQTVSDPESAVVDPKGQPYASAFSSGGGFSNIYGVPAYQSSAVANYFASHDPGYKYYSGNQTLGANGGVYNRTGRGYPDVAANGDNIAVFNAGQYGTSGGTSASTPIFASIVNRLNELRLNAGKAPIGFLNPVLYAHPEVLNDITNGTNPGCHTVGFSAVPGWDPVTGLGTPNYPKMASLFLSLP